MQGGPAPGLAELKKQLEMQTTIVEALKAELRRSKQGEAGEHDFEHSLLSLEDSLQRLGATRASVVSEMNFDGESGHADLLKELNRARATIAGLTLKQSDDLAIRCEAQQLAELRKEEIDALLENVTSQYTEISQLKVGRDSEACLPILTNPPRSKATVFDNNICRLLTLCGPSPGTSPEAADVSAV
jgi:hypothetical protein